MPILPIKIRVPFALVSMHPNLQVLRRRHRPRLLFSLARTSPLLWVLHRLAWLQDVKNFTPWSLATLALVSRACLRSHLPNFTNGTQAVSVNIPLRFSQASTLVPVLNDWHVTVGSKCENMWLKYAYCVQGPTSDTTGGPTSTGSGPASPTQSGITSNCKQYYTVASGNSCTKIETQFSVTFDQLYQWNPAIDSNCGNLWVGYAVCVAVGT